MSKVAKSVGRALGKVVDGAKKLVKSVAKSKAFKVIAIAAAVYFTGGAALGAMGGASAASAAGTSAIAGAAKGAMAGLGSAGAGISSAWSSLLGGNLSATGASLSNGITGASAAGGTAAGGGFTSAMSAGFNTTKGLLKPTTTPVATGPLASGYSPATPTGFNPGANIGSNLVPGTSTTAGNSLTSMSVDKLLEMPMTELQKQAGSLSAGQVSALKKAGIDLAGKPGLLRSMVSSPLTIPMAMQIGGNALAGKAEAEYIDKKEGEDRARYNRNIGTRLFVGNS
jgi:hypothetical protein